MYVSKKILIITLKCIVIFVGSHEGLMRFWGRAVNTYMRIYMYRMYSDSLPGLYLYLPVFKGSFITKWLLFHFSAHSS